MVQPHVDSLEHFSTVVRTCAPVPRLRILHALAARGGVSTPALARALELPQATCRRHLDALERVGLVEADEDGVWRLAEPRTVAEHVFVSAVVSAGAPDATAQRDLAALRVADPPEPAPPA